MASQRITWIALPDGFAAADGAGPARLSVFVSPQLQPDEAGTLAPFDFVDWPSRIAAGAIELTVRFGDAGVRAEVVSRPESRLWTALFDADTLVRQPETDVTSPVFGSYPAARMHDLLEEGYRQLGAQSPLDGSSRDAIPAAFAEVQELFGAASRDVLVDDPALSEGQRRELLARELFRPESADQSGERLERLVDLALSESTRARAVDGTPEFVPIVPDTGGVASTLAQFMVYHRQPGGARLVAGRRRSDARLDFHQRLTTLAEYPTLLRLLGLVIDLELDPADIPAAADDAPGSVRVEPTFIGPASVDTAFLSPDTAYVFTQGRVFAAAPSRARDGMAETVSGLLNLGLPASPGSSEDQFRILQVDVDSGGLRALDLLARAAAPSAAPDRTGEARHAFTLPPLRSDGVAVARQGSAQLLHEALTSGRRKMAALAAGEPVTLFAEDLIRGIRVDVGDPASGEWRSLHEREGTYTFLGIQEARELPDEGCIQATLVQPAPRRDGPGPSAPDPSLPNYVSESLFLWQGWSLAARRPGEALPQPETETPPAVVPGDGLGLDVSFRPRPRSLPRLRYGRSYALRARVVDLAGNGLDLDEATRIVAALGPEAPVLPRPGAQQEFRFRRFEVVPSPMVFPRGAGRQGESVERIVLRSNHDLTPEAYAELQAATHPEYAVAAERHIAPPKTWQLLAEMLGRFDAAIGTRTDHDRVYDVAVRERGSARDDAVRPEPAMDVDWLPDPLAAGASFRSLPGSPEGTVARATGEGLQFTNLPPSAATLRAAGPVVTVDFGPPAAWPDLSAFRLRLAEGSGAPAWNAGERVLTVFLAKGETRTVRLSCHLHDEAALELLGIWTWMVEEVHRQVERGELPATELPARLAELEQLSLLGLSRMLTPYRELTLVHAVQQPVEPPVLLAFDPARVAGSTFVYTRGRAQVHPASTSTVELSARWTEKLDDPLELEPRDVDVEAQVFASPFSVPDPSAAAATAPVGAGPTPAARFDSAGRVLEFPGPALEAVTQGVTEAAAALAAAHGRLRAAAQQAGVPGGATQYDAGLNVVAGLAARPLSEQGCRDLAREARMVQRQADAELADFNPPDLLEPTPDALFEPIGRIALAAGELANRAEAALAALLGFQGRHEFGDAKHRRVSYAVVATTRFGECFGPGLALTRPSDVTTVDVLSSSPPDPPGIQYVVPAFAWNRVASAADPPTDLTSERRGGLRVYLDRPWYSSGDGELLGVVVASTPQAVEFLRRGKPVATQMGRDPLWISPRTTSMPTRADFGNPAAVHPVGAPGALTTVLGFPVAFDGQGRCFCDIELSAGDAYFPFVRLALVRFQPHAVRGVETSRTVLAEFAQLVPHRGVTVVRAADDRVTVSVTGRTHESPNPRDPGGRGTRVRVSVQERIPGTSDDAGWLPAGEEAVVGPETAVPTGPVLWSGTVTVPATRAPGQFRVLIEELETHRGLDPLAPGPQALVIDRVVFAETVVI